MNLFFNTRFTDQLKRLVPTAIAKKFTLNSVAYFQNESRLFFYTIRIIDFINSCFSSIIDFHETHTRNTSTHWILSVILVSISLIGHEELEIIRRFRIETLSIVLFNMGIRTRKDSLKRLRDIKSNTK